MEKITKISSQVFTNNKNFRILEKISNKIDGKYVYKLKIKCVKCGEEQIILAPHKERCVCKKCKLNNTNNKHIGEKHGCYEIIDFDHYNE